jgi:hypothetical protein
MSDNDHFDFENLGSDTVNIQTLVTRTIMKNPKIMEVFQETSQQDASILEKKTNSFFKTTLKIDEITLIIYLCALMYENDIMPNYINSILEKLNMKIDINDLKNSANNFINILLNKKTDNLIGGSNFNFNSVKQILLHIAACLFISSILYADYVYYNNYIVPSTENAISTFAKYKQKIRKVTNFDTQCNKFVPDSVLYLDKYGVNGFSTLYKLSGCLASPENNILFSDFISEYNEKSENLASQNQYALVPLKSSNSETSNQLQIIQFNSDIQHVNDFSNSLYNRQLSSPAEIAQYKKYLQDKIDTPDNEFFKEITNVANLNTINIDESVNNEKTVVGTFQTVMGFLSDSGKVIVSLAKEVSNTGKVATSVNPLQGVTRTLKDYLTAKFREVQDLELASRRNVEDSLKEINRVIEDVYAVVYMIGILSFINSIVARLLKYYFLLIFKKMTNLRLTDGNGSQLEAGDDKSQIGDDQLQIENEQLQIENERLQIEDDPSKGGKGRTRRKRRKAMKRMKTMKRMKKMKTIKRKKQIKRKKSIKK